MAECSQNNIYLNFYKEKWLVKLPFLFSFIFWSLKDSNGLRNKLIKLGKLCLYVQVGVSRIEKGRLDLLFSSPRFSWAKYCSDGTKLIIFNHKKRTVSKVSLINNKDQILNEINYRKKIEEWCPPLISFDPTGIIVEQFIELRRPHSRQDAFSRAIAILKANLYETIKIDVAQYISKFEPLIKIEEMKSFILMRGLQSIILSPVHGDIWYGNILYDKDGKVHLLDWEYARICIISHDVWSYLFQLQKERGLPFDNNFYEFLYQNIKEFFNMDLSKEQLQCLHLLHLLERYYLFINLNLESKKIEIEYLFNQMNSILRE